LKVLGWTALAALTTTEVFLYSQNIMFNYPWRDSKSELGVMGFVETQLSRTMLAGNRLNLGEVYGHHDLQLDPDSPTAEPPEQIELEFSLPESSYLDLTFGRSAGGFQGVRLSRSRRLPPIVFRSDPNGEFLSQELIPVGKVHNGWHRAVLQADAAGATTSLEIDGKKEASLEAGMSKGGVGVRSGEIGAVVRDYRVRYRGGKEFHEQFTFWRGGRELFLWSLLICSLTNALIFAVAGRNAERICSAVALALVLFFVFDFAYWSRLPFPGWQDAGRMGVLSKFDDFRRQVLARAVRLVGHGSIPLGNPAKMQDLQLPNGGRRLFSVWKDWQGNGYCRPFAGRCERIEDADLDSLARMPKLGCRILWLGGSQTFGSGAWSPEEDYFSLSHHALASDPSITGPIESFNLADRGEQGVARMQYLSFIGKLHPDLIIYGAGPTEALDGPAAVLSLSEPRGISSLFLYGPRDPEEWRPTRDFPGQGLVDDILKPRHARTLKLDEALDAKVVMGGVTHWDGTHLTGYGHKLVARVLVPVIAHELHASNCSAANVSDAL
jgi:hypothetical protein